MNEDMQQQFVSWLAQKLGAKDEQDLKAKMQQLGNDGIKQAYNSFMQEQQQSAQGQQSIPQQLQGGKLEYLRLLQAYKKGGKMAMEAKAKEMKSGGRVDKQEDATKKDYMNQRKDGKGNPLSAKADHREDKNKQDSNPGLKDKMSKGKKKEWITARTDKSTGTNHLAKDWTTALTKVPKGKEGMVTPSQQKMIDLDKAEKGKKKGTPMKQQAGGMLPAKKGSKKQMQAPYAC